MSKKTGSYIKSEPRDKNRKSVPILAIGIGTRIGDVADLIGARKSAAEVAGVSVASLQRYIAEEVEPTFSAMTGLARAANVNLEWLATGEGPMKKGEGVAVAPLDRELMRLVVEEVELLLEAENGYLEPEKKAELIVLLYEEAREQEGKLDRARVLKFIKLAS